MEQNPIENKIQEILHDTRLELPAFSPTEERAVIHRFRQYLDLWAKWNEKTNLTAETSPIDFLRNHIFVSLQFVRAVKSQFGIADIGSGAGLPGIPIKIVLPELFCYLVESRRKRANFLKTVVRELECENIQVENERVEE